MARSAAPAVPPAGGRLPHAARALFTPVVLVLSLLGPVMAGLAFQVARERQNEFDRDHLEDLLAVRAGELRAGLRSTVETLHAVRSFFDCSEHVTQDEFARYTQDARRRHPTIQAIEWIPRVLESDRASHVRDAVALDHEDYAIRELDTDGNAVPAASRGAYFPVRYVEPLVGNESALGFDVGSEARRRAALERAAATGEAVLTEPLTLVQEQEEALSVLGFLAVFEDDAGGPRALMRVRGFVLVVSRIPDLVCALGLDRCSGETADVELRLLDPDVDGRPLPLFATAGWGNADHGALGLSAQEIRLGGQTWALQGQPSAAYLDARRTYQPFVVGLVALLLWGLLCGFLLLIGKRARDRETRSQAKFVRSVLQSLSEGVLVADAHGRIQLANDAADRLLGAEGRPAHAPWSSTLGDTTSGAGSSLPVEQMPLSRAIQGQHVAHEDVFVRGSTAESGIWLSVSASPIRGDDEDVAGGVVVFRDITDRKRSEAAILRLSEAVEQSADAVFITDRRGQIEYVNAAFENTTGYSRDEILGQSPRLFGPDDYTDEEYRALWRNLMRGKVFRTSDTTRRKDGQVYDVEQTITPVRDARGRVTHIVSVARDVTEKRRLREQEVEMELAAQVQQALFPQSAPDVEGFDIAGAVFPAAETSGDYYDYIQMPDGGITLAIGDVSGHGFGPALLMAETRAYLRSLLAGHDGLETVLARLNHSLLVDFQTDHFVTLLLAWIDPTSRALVHANAGHVPGFVLGPNGEAKASLTGTGTILGIFDDREYACGEPISLQSGDVVVLLTDGVTETQSVEGAFFGLDGALRSVRESRERSAEEILDQLWSAVRAFSREDEPRDDTTIVVCKVL